MVVTSKWILGNADGEDRARALDPPAQRNVAQADLGVGVLFDRLLEAVVIARAATGRIVLWNPAAEKLFGYPAAEVIGQSIEILMPRPIAEVHRAGFERYQRTGHGLIIDADSPVEMPARRRDGEAIRVELALSELHSPAGERFVVAVIRDATHRRQLELTNLELAQARAARAEAEAEVAARDDLLESVAAALSTTPEPDELRRLATALTDFRRLREGELTLRPRDADLVDLVHATADPIRRRAAGRHVLVHTPPSVPATFDAARTRHVLEQVLDEAIQRTGFGGRVDLKVEQLSPQTAQLTVRAEGTGSPREPGVGLHLSRSLMQRQGGTLSASLTSSGGLEVVLTLPGCPHLARRRRPAPPKTTGRRPGP